MRFYAARSAVPVVLHLDHGHEEALVAKALELGFSSVMFDGSSQPLEENIRRTREMVQLAHGRGVCIEGELGRFGQEQGEGPGKAQFTDPAEAATFVRETGVDLLAPAVGNAHGFYKQPPQLRFDLIDQIRCQAGVPLSLHGGTGLPMEDIRRSAELGVRKMNVATLLHKQYSDVLKNSCLQNPDKQYSWRKVLEAGRQAIHETVRQYLAELRTEGMAE